MNMPQALFFSVCVLALAIVAASFNTAESQQRGASYMVAASGGQFVWRVNTATGAVSYCLRRDNSTDEALLASRPPYCSASSAAASN